MIRSKRVSRTYEMLLCARESHKKWHFNENGKYSAQIMKQISKCKSGESPKRVYGSIEICALRCVSHAFTTSASLYVMRDRQQCDVGKLCNSRVSAGVYHLNGILRTAGKLPIMSLLYKASFNESAELILTSVFLHLSPQARDIHLGIAMKKIKVLWELSASMWKTVTLLRCNRVAAINCWMGVKSEIKVRNLQEKSNDRTYI